jgi:predicted ATP-binding protein involved in virulence
VFIIWHWQNNVVDSLMVTWPDGKAQVIVNVKTNQIITLKNSEAVVVPHIENYNTEQCLKKSGQN